MVLQRRAPGESGPDASSQGPVIDPLEANQTGLRGFGHFCAEVPKSLHIGAYPRVLLIAGCLSRCYEIPASSHISLPAGLEDRRNCHAEGRGFESHQPLFRECPARGRVGFGAGRRSKIEPSTHIAVIPGTGAH
jgi:hypothetical protein